MSALINTDKEYLEWVEDVVARYRLLICKSKDDVYAQYSLEGNNPPLGISGFEGVNILPDDNKHSLPSIEEIENELKHIGISFRTSGQSPSTSMRGVTRTRFSNAETFTSNRFEKAKNRQFFGKTIDF